MKRIAVLGASAVAVKVIDELAQMNESCQFMIFSFDGYFPSDRSLYAKYIAQGAKPEDLFPKPKEFYTKNNIKVILDKKIARINVRKKIITTDEKEQFEYDILIIADTPENRYSDIKGTNKAGVFGIKKLKDIDQIYNTIPLIDTVAVQSDTLAGLEIASSFANRNKEVFLITSEKGFINKHVDQSAQEWLIQNFESKGVRILLNEQIEEVLGDKDAKAIRIKSRKILSTQMIVFTQMDEDMRLFATANMEQLNGRFIVNDQYQTNVEATFAIDLTCRSENIEPVTHDNMAVFQAKKVANAISGKSDEVSLEQKPFSCQVAGLPMTVMGQLSDDGSIKAHSVFNPENQSYTRLYLSENCLVGAVLINNEAKKTEYWQAITNNTSIEIPEAPAVYAMSIVAEGDQESEVVQKGSVEPIESEKVEENIQQS